MKKENLLYKRKLTFMIALLNFLHFRCIGFATFFATSFRRVTNFYKALSLKPRLRNIKFQVKYGSLSRGRLNFFSNRNVYIFLIKIHHLIELNKSKELKSSIRALYQQTYMNSAICYVFFLNII